MRFPRPVAGSRDTSRADYAIVAAFMLVHIASSVFGAAGPDTTRDVAAAVAIRDHTAFPLHGPLLAGTSHLGPIWFYLLALPASVFRSWVAIAAFVALLSSLQFALAFAAGRRLLDSRLGLLWCVMLAVPGWASFQLVGFSHTNMVATCTMLTLYALVRLTQEQQPRWLIVAGLAFGLALHAHPSTVWLALLIVPAAVVALRKPGPIARWSVPALAAATVPLLPLAFEPLNVPAANSGLVADFLRGTMHVGNLANLPGLFWGVLVRGPEVVTSAFLGPWPAVASIAVVAILAVELAAACGLLAIARADPRALTIGLAATVACAVIIALARPVTPFYMTYALLPLLAGLGAMGWWALCSAVGERGKTLLAALIVAVFALHALTAAAIARAIESGTVSVAVSSRLDVKQDDALRAPPESWWPAHAVDASGRWLCKQREPIVLHGTYAFFEDLYVGLDHRLHCGILDVRLMGMQPDRATHVIGLPRAAWAALGWEPTMSFGGMGTTQSLRAIWPRTGFAPADGSVYPPRAIGGSVAASFVNTRLPRGDAVAISLPYATWMSPPSMQVSANDVIQRPIFRDSISTVYACRDCARSDTTDWRIDIRSAAPERIDIVALPAPGTR